MTITAGILIEGHGKAVAMTVCAGERISIGMRLVRGQLEGRGAVIEHGRRPARGTVTGSTVGAKSAGMRIILGMTGSTVLRRTLEDTVDMAAFAFHIGVFAVQMECEL